MNPMIYIIPAIIIEGIVGYVKLLFIDKKVQWQVIVAIIIGVLVAFFYNVDLFANFGLVSKVPHIGNILTGLVLARGSNYVSDLIKLIGYQKDCAKICANPERQSED